MIALNAFWRCVQCDVMVNAYGFGYQLYDRIIGDVE